MLKAPLGFVTERGFSSFQFVRAPGRVPLNPLMNRGFWAHGCAPLHVTPIRAAGFGLRARGLTPTALTEPD